MPVACERSSAAGRSEWFKVVLLACLGVAADERSQSGAQLLPVWHPVSGVCSRRFAPGLIEARLHLSWRHLLPAFRAGLISPAWLVTSAPAPGVSRRASLKRHLEHRPEGASACSRRFAPGLIEARAGVHAGTVCSRRFAPGLIEATACSSISTFRRHIDSACSRRFAPGLIEARTRSGSTSAYNRLLPAFSAPWPSY